MNKLSLKSRIIATLCLFSLALSIVFAAIAVLNSETSQDYVFNKTLRHITDEILTEYLTKTSDKHLEHLPPELRAQVGLDGISDEQIARLRLRTLPDGVYEANSPHDMHYSITSIHGSEKKLYVFFDVAEIHFDFDNFQVLAVQLGLPIVLTSIIGAVIGLFLAKHIISPVGRLAQQVGKATPENLIDSFSEEYADDEIGDLARSIESTMHRLSKFIAREQDFTRNVSHELRTPLAVIKNGAELLRSQTEACSCGSGRIIDRIDRAVAEMEQLVETFLLLAREKDISASSRTCDLIDRTHHLLAGYDFLRQDRRVTYQVLATGRPVVHVAPEILDIILGNCIRNAFQYAAQGDIVVEIGEIGITITNPVVQENSCAGPGIGLSIAARLCERLGWTFNFQVGGGNAVAQLRYHPS